LLRAAQSITVQSGVVTIPAPEPVTVQLLMMEPWPVISPYPATELRTCSESSRHPVP
jgi:hypothetical protein